MADEKNPYGNNPYGNNPYGGNPYGGNPYGGNPYGGNPYGGNPYGGSPYGSSPYGSNPYGNTTPQPSVDEDDKTSFNLMDWALRILNYWYLFVIGVIVAFSLAYIENRKVITNYLSAGTIIIKEYGGYGNSSLMMGFGVDAGYKNVNNQMIMLSSYDLISRVVDSLPFMNVEYITQGRFKTRNIYHNTPIEVQYDRVEPMAYGILFELMINHDGTFSIGIDGADQPFLTSGSFGTYLSTPYFSGVVWPTQNMRQGRVLFRFRDKGSLVEEFKGRLQLGFVSEGSSVLQLSLVSDVPDRDCEFINKLCEIFLLQNVERKNAVAENSIKFINEQLGILQESLVVSEGAMTDFRRQNKFIDVSSYASTLISKMETYEAQGMSLRLKETYLDYLTNYLERNMSEEAIMAPSSLSLNEPMLTGLVQQLNDLQLQRAELSDKNVYYSKFTNDINNVKAAIQEVIKSMRASLDIEKEDLRRRSQDVEAAIQRLPEKELQMVSLERAYRIDDNYYTFFLQKRAEAEIQKASNTPDNDILDKARVLWVTNSSSKRNNTTRYLMFGILIPLIIVILFELLQNRIRNPKEADTVSRFPLIGTLRHAKSQNPTLVQTSPRSSYSEMLRTIRSRIEFIVQRKKNISISITSTQSGDGKTFLSSNLASLYAMMGRKTVLVDLDIRKPNIHEKLGIESRYGVTNYLIGDCEYKDILHTNLPFKFDVIAAGTVPPNPGELIRSDKLTELIERLKQEYEIVIIDSSPIGQVPDASALVEQTDLCLYVIRCMQTNKSYCKATLEQLYTEFPTKIKIVLSDIPTSDKHRFGYYSGGYGYGGYGYGGYGGYGYGYGGYGSRRNKNKNNYYTDEEA